MRLAGYMANGKWKGGEGLGGNARHGVAITMNSSYLINFFSL